MKEVVPTRFSLIVAVSENGVIGNGGKLPWHIPEDLAYFKKRTLGKPLIMGRSTLESIGRTLPGRTNIVLSRHRDLNERYPNAIVVPSDIEAYVKARELGAEEIMVIGGETIYRQFMPLISRAYITRVGVSVEGDACLPELGAGWELTEVCEPTVALGQTPYRMEVWEKTDFQQAKAYGDFIVGETNTMVVAEIKKKPFTLEELSKAIIYVPRDGDVRPCKIEEARRAEAYRVIKPGQGYMKNEMSESTLLGLLLIGLIKADGEEGFYSLLSAVEDLSIKDYLGVITELRRLPWEDVVISKGELKKE